MVIALSGATGFIGKRFQTLYPPPQHTIVPLRRNWVMETKKAIDGCDAVVHLAGEPVAQRWNRRVKELIRESRTAGTSRVVPVDAYPKEIAYCKRALIHSA